MGIVRTSPVLPGRHSHATPVAPSEGRGLVVGKIPLSQPGWPREVRTVTGTNIDVCIYNTFVLLKSLPNVVLTGF